MIEADKFQMTTANSYGTFSLDEESLIERKPTSHCSMRTAVAVVSTFTLLASFCCYQAGRISSAMTMDPAPILGTASSVFTVALSSFYLGSAISPFKHASSSIRTAIAVASALTFLASFGCFQYARLHTVMVMDPTLITSLNVISTIALSAFIFGAMSQPYSILSS